MGEIEGATVENIPDGGIVNEFPPNFAGDRVRMNIWVKKPIWQGVMDIAKSEDISVSDVVRNALKEHIRKCKSRVR